MTELFTFFGNLGADTLEQAGMIAKLAGQFGVTWPLLMAQVINFCVVAFILYRFAFRPVLKTMDQRQKKIADGLQYAEEMKHKLDESEKHYAETVSRATHEAQHIIHEAREKAKKHIEEQSQEAVNRAEGIIKEANESIEQERQRIIASVKSEMQNLAVDIAQKALSTTLSEADRQAFNKAATQELTAAHSDA